MPSKATTKRAPTRTVHHRVTVPRSHKAATLPGMHQASAVTQAGSTAHFRVSYLTSLGQTGAELAAAILENCERDYNLLSPTFGGLTPESLPFVVEITSDNTGASHSSCMGTDIPVCGKSGGNADFIRSLLVAEEDEVFMGNSAMAGIAERATAKACPGFSPTTFTRTWNRPILFPRMSG